VTLVAIEDIPLIEEGDDLAHIVEKAITSNGLTLRSGDCLVIAQKVVSKAEGRSRNLTDIIPTPKAIVLAAEVEKDPRLVELILRESSRVIAHCPGVLIVEHRLGIVHANAGIDRSNVCGADTALLLPEQPDASAHIIRQQLKKFSNAEIGVIISDTAGRAWRNGAIGFAIGCAGMAPLKSLVAEPDLFGRLLETTEVAVADEIAAAASLLMGQAGEGRPVILVRGIGVSGENSGGASRLIRPQSQDLFR